MDPLGITQPVVADTSSSLPVYSAPAAAAVSPTVSNPVPAAAELSDNQASSQITDADIQQAEQKRLQAVQQMAQTVASMYPLGSEEFTIFKDATGQYVTRYTSLLDGSVKYVPEPQLVKMSGANTQAALNIKA